MKRLKVQRSFGNLTRARIETASATSREGHAAAHEYDKSRASRARARRVVRWRLKPWRGRRLAKDAGAHIGRRRHGVATNSFGNGGRTAQ
jgi:hypothetical protein